MGILRYFKLPESLSINDLDSIETAMIHRKVILSKKFLKDLYTDFYNDLNVKIPQAHRKCMVEIGSGAGFIKSIIPEVITSDVFSAEWIDQVFTAEAMPFKDGSVDVFILFDVFHHLPQPAKSLREMIRCLRSKGKIIMIEPANTPWLRFIAKNFHHETFDMNADWRLEGSGRLSASNIALPWIVFVRDQLIFQRDFPELSISRISLHSPFRYLISGGLTYKSFLPDWTYKVIRWVEMLVAPLNRYLAFFQTIELEKN